MSALRRLALRRCAHAGTLLGLAFALVGSLSCGGSDAAAPPTPGELFLHLEGAEASDEAVLLTIAPGATAVEGSGSTEIHARAAGNVYTVAVFGALTAGSIVRLSVADIGHPPAVTIREVATSDGALRTQLSTYRIRVTTVR